LATNEVYINKTTNEKITSTNGITLLFAIKQLKFVKTFVKRDKIYREAVLNRASGRRRMETKIHKKFRLPSLLFSVDKRC
jgi:SPX domain protein involved in polyphosphate accumulation